MEKVKAFFSVRLLSRDGCGWNILNFMISTYFVKWAVRLIWRLRRLRTRLLQQAACIPERGSLDASNHLWAGMRSITQNWQRPAYYLGADVRNFFVSIHKPTLFELVMKKTYEPWLKELTAQVLFHDPRQNCVLKSKSEAFGRVPQHKSLWHTPIDRGLPIGNLTSQFFANV